MSKPVLTVHQPSLTEWFAALGTRSDLAALKDEDNTRSERFDTLFEIIGLPSERATVFSVSDLQGPSQKFKDYLVEHGNELCAIRLVPKSEGYQKLRQRGLTVTDCYTNWFLKQTVSDVTHTVEILPHNEVSLWAASFAVGEKGIFGEIINGRHNQLTQGNTATLPEQFYFDYDNWFWSNNIPESHKVIQKMVHMLLVPHALKQEQLINKINATFSHQYLQGYFETTVWGNGDIYFIDYNRLLNNFLNFNNPFIEKNNSNTFALKGNVAFTGIAQGVVRIIEQDTIPSAVFNEGDILVTDNTDVRFLPLMKKAAAIITKRGGILSHAAIVARELKKPCLVGVSRATELLKDGQLVLVDGEKGVVVTRPE